MQERMVGKAERLKDLCVANSAAVGLDPNDIAFRKVQAWNKERLVAKKCLSKLADQAGFAGAWTTCEKVQ